MLLLLLLVLKGQHVLLCLRQMEPPRSIIVDTRGAPFRVVSGLSTFMSASDAFFFSPLSSCSRREGACSKPPAWNMAACREA